MPTLRLASHARALSALLLLLTPTVVRASVQQASAGDAQQPRTLGTAPGRAPSAGSSPEDSLLIEGVSLKPDPSGGLPELFHFSLRRADSTVVITSLGRVDISLGPLSTIPDAANASDSGDALTIPAPLLLSVARQVETALDDASPSSAAGLTVQNGRLHISFARGASLGVLALIALLIAGLAVAATVLIIVARDRRRSRAAGVLARRQIEAGEAERTRLAREIHDGPLQDLHAVRARAEAMGGAAESATTMIVDGVGDIALELRAIAEGLRPPALGRFGLAAALISHGRRFTERFPHVRVAVRAGDDVPALSPAAEASLFRVAQEALTNAVRHGRAHSVVVEYAAEPTNDAPERIRLEVRDDGSGMAGMPDADMLAAQGHFGMAGMRERAKLLGGRLDVFTPTPEASPRSLSGHTPGPGTAIQVTVPWDAVAPSSS